MCPSVQSHSPSTGRELTTPRRLSLSLVGEGQLEIQGLINCPPPLLHPNFTEEKTSPFLREVQVNLIDFRKCNDYLVYDSYLTPRMMCAGDLRGGRDSCQVRQQGQGSGPGILGWKEVSMLGLMRELGLSFPEQSLPLSPAPWLTYSLSPSGRQRGTSCLPAEQPLVPGGCHQLGHRLWPEKQAWGVHQSDRSPSLDLQQDGGECLAPALHWTVWLSLEMGKQGSPGPARSTDRGPLSLSVQRHITCWVCCLSEFPSGSSRRPSL